MRRRYSYEKARSRPAQERLDRMQFYTFVVLGVVVVAAVLFLLLRN